MHKSVARLLCLLLIPTSIAACQAGSHKGSGDQPTGSFGVTPTQPANQPSGQLPSQPGNPASGGSGSSEKPLVTVPVTYPATVTVSKVAIINFSPPAPYNLVGLPGYLFAAATNELTDPSTLNPADFPTKYKSFPITLTSNSYSMVMTLPGKVTAFFAWDSDEAALATPLMQVLVQNPSTGGSMPGTIDIPLTVQEVLPKGVAGFARSGELATFGLPFAQGQVFESGARPLLGIEQAAVYQFRTVERWPDQSVKWALVDVKTDLPAGGMVTNFHVTAGPGASAQANLAQESASLIQLSTGPLVVDVRKANFNLLDRIVVDGKTLLASGTNDGAFGTDAGGAALHASGTTVVSLEENGPARAVVKAEGSLVNASGQRAVDFTCRLTARSGLRTIEVEFTVRNSNPNYPKHMVVKSIELPIHFALGTALTARLAKHDGETQTTLGATDEVYLYQAYSDAATYGVTGDGPAYRPHLPKVVDPDGPDEPGEKGYRITRNSTALFSTSDKTLYPPNGWVDQSGSAGGVTVAIQKMPYLWPAALEARGDGTLTLGLFTKRNAAPYTFVYRQHESRTAILSFHTGAASSPNLVAKSLDYPIQGRASNYAYYDQTGAFAYRLVTVVQQNQAYAAMGVAHVVTAYDEDRLVIRFQAAHETGGYNNQDSIEKNLATWLRLGQGGRYDNALDRALYLAEWQILRSDGVTKAAMPAVTNDDLPHTTGQDEDLEHRYRDGMVLAYHLTGDERLRAGLFDEAENLLGLNKSPQERSMYQTHRALAIVGEFTGDEKLRTELKSWIQFHTHAVKDVATLTDGWGWQTAQSDAGSRRYFANSTQSETEKGPGENFMARGFISGSLGPLAYFHAARYLGTDDPDGLAIRGRLRDLAYWTRKELFPFNPDPAQRHWVYSYGLATKNVYEWSAALDHELLLGMSEAFQDTCDAAYLQKGIEFIQAAMAQDHTSGYANDMIDIDTRLPAQNFMRVYLDYKAGLLCSP